MRNGWVVPPLRRLSSIAYGVQSPLGVLDHDEVDREPAEDALPRASRAPIVDRLRADRPGVGEVGRKPAAEVALAARARRAAGRGSTAARPRPVGVTRSCTLGLRSSTPGDPLLDDPAVARRAWRRTRRTARPGTRSAMPLAPRSGSCGPLVRRPGRRQVPQVDERVARARDALVELDDAPRVTVGRVRPQLGAARRRRRRSSCRSSKPSGWRTPSSAKSRRQPVLVPSGEQPRIGAVHRDAEGQRDVALERRRVVRHEVRARRGRGSARAMPREQPGPLEQLLAQRPRRGVVDGDEVRAGRGRGSG